MRLKRLARTCRDRHRQSRGGVDPLRLGLLWLIPICRPTSKSSRWQPISRIATRPRPRRATGARRGRSPSDPVTKLAAGLHPVPAGEGTTSRGDPRHSQPQELVIPGFVDGVILRAANLLGPRAIPRVSRRHRRCHCVLGDEERQSSLLHVRGRSDRRWRRSPPRRSRRWPRSITTASTATAGYSAARRRPSRSATWATCASRLAERQRGLPPARRITTGFVSWDGFVGVPLLCTVGGGIRRRGRCCLRTPPSSQCRPARPDSHDGDRRDGHDRTRQRRSSQRP